jgi:hypothetical protein
VGDVVGAVVGALVVGDVVGAVVGALVVGTFVGAAVGGGVHEARTSAPVATMDEEDDNDDVCAANVRAPSLMLLANAIRASVLIAASPLKHKTATMEPDSRDTEVTSPRLSSSACSTC